MKHVICGLIVIVFASGCSKVSEEPVQCSGYSLGLAVPNQTVAIGGSAEADVSPYPGAAVKWTGPNHFSSSSTSIQVLVADASYYGLYTVTQYLNNCTSPIDTFYVLPINSGTPPCTISSSNYNRFQTTDGFTFQFTGATISQNSNCSNYFYDVSAQNSNGYTFDMYCPNAPVAGTYYQLTSSCAYLGQGQASISMNVGGAYYYNSLSGNAYCNVINGKTYITLCGASFLNASSSVPTTINGNLQFH